MRAPPPTSARARRSRPLLSSWPVTTEPNTMPPIMGITIRPVFVAETPCTPARNSGRNWSAPKRAAPSTIVARMETA